MRTINSGDSFTISCKDLHATVLTPWSTLYRRTRFHHSAFVANVEKNGFCFTQRERDQPNAPSTGGRGLCCEYKCPELELDVAVGEKWLKPGVGVLTREERPWSHLDERRAEELPTQVCVCADAAVFTTQAGPVAGTAYNETRRLRMGDGFLRLDVLLQNRGEHTLTLLDYCHNFIALNQTPTDDKTHLRLPAMLAPEGIEPAETLVGEPGGVTWRGIPSKAFFRPMQAAKSAAPAWRLVRDDMPLQAQESVSFTPNWLTLWGDSYCVCAEVYQRLTLAPGEQAQWWREWRFVTEPMED